MKTINNIVLLTIGLFLACSCSDFLLKEPNTLTPENYFNTETELSSFLTGVYSPLMQENFYGNYYFTNNSGGDDLSFYQRSTAISDGAVICANINSGNSSITQFWRLLYDGINRANILIENVDHNTSIAQTIRDRTRAEALFLRSFYYYNLVQGWGDVPFRLKASVYYSPDSLNLPRTPKQLIYDRIIKDINTAIPYLYTSDQLSYTGRVTQSAAKGVLARIYLFRAGENNRDVAVGNELTNTTDSIKAYFTHARDLCESIKNSGLHGLAKPYRSIFSDMCQDKYNSMGIRESIWEAEEAGSRSAVYQAAGRLGNTIGFGATNDYSTVAAYSSLLGVKNPGYSYQFIFASVKLFEMYEAEGDTARCDWNIAPFVYMYSTATNKPVTGKKYWYGKKPATIVSGHAISADSVALYDQKTSDASKTRCSAKYRRELEVVIPKNKNYTPINAPIIHYSDVLLMLAEAENELNDVPTNLAYDCIDAVRTRAGIMALKGNGLTKDQFRDALKRERAMELCFEGIRRWDLIRWGDYYAAMSGMSAYVSKTSWSTSYSYAANYYKISTYYNYFPIPDMEMSVNKSIIKNNPGW